MTVTLMNLDYFNRLAKALEAEGLNDETADVVLRFAKTRGADWRAELMTDWMTGRDVPNGDELVEDGGCYLRRLRNTKGPGWLDGLTF